MSNIRKSTIGKALIAGLFLLLTWLAESFSGVFSVRQAIRFGKGEENDTYDMDVWSWLTLGISAIGAFFYVATMFFARRSAHETKIDLISDGKDIENDEGTKKENDEESHNEKEKESDGKAIVPASATVLHVGHSHSLHSFHSKKHLILHLAKESGEFLVIAVPFALLAYGSSLPFWQMVESELEIPGFAYTLSTACGLADGVGNAMLHTRHFDEGGTLSLFKRLGRWEKIWALMLITLVLVGHLAQGGLDGYAFLSTFRKIYLLVQLIISLILGFTVMACEGHTEIKSTLWYEVHKKDIPPHLLSSIILFLPAVLHGLQPGLGPIILLEMLYKTITGLALANEAPLYLRLILLGVSIGLIGYFNGLTFQRTVLPAATKIIDNTVGAVKSVSNCMAGLFWHGDNEEEERGIRVSENRASYRSLSESKDQEEIVTINSSEELPKGIMRWCNLI